MCRDRAASGKIYIYIKKYIQGTMFNHSQKQRILLKLHINKIVETIAAKPQVSITEYMHLIIEPSIMGTELI
jgi:hypothetical protein